MPSRETNKQKKNSEYIILKEKVLRTLHTRQLHIFKDSFQFVFKYYNSYGWLLGAAGACLTLINKGWIVHEAQAEP